MWKLIIVVLNLIALGLLYLIYQVGGWLPVVEVLAVSIGVTAWGIYRENRGKRP